MCHVTTAQRSSNENLHTSQGQRDFSAIKLVTLLFAKRSSPLKNSTPIEACDNHTNRNGFIQPDTERHTLNVSRISKPVGMLVNAMQKALTHWENGKNYAGKINTNASIVENANNLLKTISNLFQWAGQTISLTFNLCVVLAIVANGRSFNIYENPELLKL